tara:strand:- start:13112 stop:13819 length:708 start_codon:yes stop_codon:yes gene_type:complete
MNKVTLVITAVSDFLTSRDGLKSGTLARCVSSFNALNASIIIAVPTGREASVSESLEAYSPGIDVAVLGVPEDTKGALASAVSALAIANLDEGELLIAAGDTEFLSPDPLVLMDRFSKDQVEMGTIVFRSEDPRFSYLNINSDGRVNYVLEKRVVGEFATTGVFYFRGIKNFLDAAEWCFVNNSSFQGNFYVSAALNYSLYLGGHVTWYEIAKSQFQKELDSGSSPIEKEERMHD